MIRKTRPKPIRPWLPRGNPLEVSLLICPVKNLLLIHRGAFATNRSSALWGELAWPARWSSADYEDGKFRIHYQLVPARSSSDPARPGELQAAWGSRQPWPIRVSLPNVRAHDFEAPSPRRRNRG